MGSPYKTIAFHTLGCKLNYAETSTIARNFISSGYAQVDFQDPADIYIINSCSVTQNADKKVRKMVRQTLNRSPSAQIAIVGCYAQLKPGAFSSSDGATSGVRQLYEDFYSGEHFVKVVPAPPQSKQTLGNNMCLIYPTIDPRTSKLIIISCLDNLVKGAAGQAIQNMNLMYDLEESTALDLLAVYP